jgi:hypothetical protein
MNERRRPVVLGVTPEAYSFIRIDKQIRFRFKKHELRRLKAADLLLFMKAWIFLQPLRKPSSINPNFAREVLERTGGHVGTVILLLKELAQKAIDLKIESINSEVLKSVEFIDDSQIINRRNSKKATARNSSAKKSLTTSGGQPTSKKAPPKKTTNKNAKGVNEDDIPSGKEIHPSDTLND